MTRVVADTNVYVSALHFGGVADEVLALARPRNLVVAWTCSRSPHNNPGFRANCAACRLAIITEDEPDNRILECAVATKLTPW